MVSSLIEPKWTAELPARAGTAGISGTSSDPASMLGAVAVAAMLTFIVCACCHFYTAFEGPGWYLRM
jgi:hypothetical protein